MKRKKKRSIAYSPYRDYLTPLRNLVIEWRRDARDDGDRLHLQACREAAAELRQELARQLDPDGTSYPEFRGWVTGWGAHTSLDGFNDAVRRLIDQLAGPLATVDEFEALTAAVEQAIQFLRGFTAGLRSRFQSTAMKPSRQVAQPSQPTATVPPLRFDGVDEETGRYVVVVGDARKLVNDTQRRVIEALSKAGSDGLRTYKLRQTTGLADPRKVLARLVKDAAWRAVIEMPGRASQGGYRLRSSPRPGR